jgi:glycosyltransferase involved in cell wall biosynthesis
LAELVATDPSTATGAIEALNRCDVAIVQHEYGLYGGSDGSNIIRVLEGVQIPKIVVLHTVLPNPTAHQKDILNAVIARADHLVVMTSAAAKVLEMVNDVELTQVEVIPHGAAVTSVVSKRQFDSPPLLLTWGLIGPGKGIEWVIDAMAGLRDLTPTPHYLVMGRTHPKVLAYEGDVYRHMLELRVSANGVGDLVRFDNAYYDLDLLTTVVTSADAVILPYDSSDQATSGVLVDAIAAGRPVIATPFPHSSELLASGAGIFVNHRDPDSIRDAIRRVVTEPALASAMAREARNLAPGLSWDAVAEQYVRAARPFLQRANADA